MKNNFIDSDSRYIICTHDQSVKNTFFYVQEAGHIKSADAASPFIGQTSDSFLIAAVISGRGELKDEDTTLSLIMGDCLFADCRRLFSCKSSEEEPWEIMWICFNGLTAEKYHEHFSVHQKYIFRPVFFDKIVSSLSDIIGLCENDEKNAEILCSKYITDILTDALTAHNNEQQFDSGLKQKLSMVHSYIEENFSEDLSLEKLSSQFYISKFYLTREYKKIYGKTIFQHIINARINYGKKLLRFSDKSIEDIAHLCGFNDQSYFARQFKKSENLTCFSYRKMWRD